MIVNRRGFFALLAAAIVPHVWQSSRARDGRRWSGIRHGYWRIHGHELVLPKVPEIQLTNIRLKSLVKVSDELIADSRALGDFVDARPLPSGKMLMAMLKVDAA